MISAAMVVCDLEALHNALERFRLAFAQGLEALFVQWKWLEAFGHVIAVFVSSSESALSRCCCNSGM
jgi:hypothetical protein